MSKTTRTTYVAHVGNVTVSVNGALETVRGPIPTCRTCGRLLRPNYATTRTRSRPSKTLTRLFKGSFGAYSGQSVLWSVLRPHMGSAQLQGATAMKREYKALRSGAVVDSDGAIAYESLEEAGIRGVHIANVLNEFHARGESPEWDEVADVLRKRGQLPEAGGSL